jgi:Flp pilus assembly protein TadG
MISHVGSLLRLLRRLRRSNRGTVTIFTAVGAIAFVGFAAITVDVAYVFHDKRVLQASADAAALAGAMDLYNNGANSAVTTASTYSGASGKKNANPYLSVTAAAHTINCTGYTGATCTVTTTNPNGIVVTETANAPLYFARIFGASTLALSVTSYALSTGGKNQNLDVAVIIDSTASMNTSDSSCSIPSASRLDCAVAGLQTLLRGFTPPDQQVALFTFPGLPSTTAAAQEYDCSSTTPSSIAQYNASPVYMITGLSTDFKSGSSLNTSSNLVKAARAGAAGCTAGMSAIGGAGTFYADAVTTASNYLTASGRSGVNKMVILLSDGDANSSSAPSTNNECQQGVSASGSAQSAGKLTVVTIAYGASTSAPPGSCSTDSSNLSACSALLKMASKGNGTVANPQWFYSDTTGGSSSCTSSAHSITDLNAIFQDIGSSFTNARLIPSS